MHGTTQFCVPGPFLAPVFDRLQHAKVQVSQTGVRDGLEMQIVCHCWRVLPWTSSLPSPSMWRHEKLCLSMKFHHLSKLTLSPVTPPITFMACH